MADDKPVRKAVRKTTTKKRVVKKVATKKVATKRAIATKSKRSGMFTLKFVLIAVLVLIIGSAGTFYIGYTAEGSIDLNARLSDKGNYVNQDDFDNNERPIPRPNAARPVLEVAEEIATPEPEPEVEGAATSTDETASSTDATAEEGDEDSESVDGDAEENSEDSDESTEGDAETEEVTTEDADAAASEATEGDSEV